jgi:hypothetical protein
MHSPGVKAHGYAVHHVEDYEEQPLWPVQKSTCDVKKINRQYASNPDDFSLSLSSSNVNRGRSSYKHCAHNCEQNFHQETA